MKIQTERDNLLTDAGIETLKDRYLLPDEDPQSMFARVAKAYANDDDHAQRLYDYMSKLWFMPSTPILANGGTRRGLPISCFLQNVEDNMGDIIENWKETSWLSCKGGGIGVYYGNVRSVGERVGVVGKTSGIIPFLKVNESLAGAISQGSLRRGSAAVYLPIWHGDIEEFIEVRTPTGGDPNRKVNPTNLHHGVVIDDKFMEAVEQDETYPLLSPDTGAEIRRVKARDLWIKILGARLKTGEPYLVFGDRLKEGAPLHHSLAGLFPIQSNLCSEITLPTSQTRTAVCCLSSANAEYFDDWSKDENFISDIMYFLDNVLESFINNAPDEMNKAKFSAMRERSVGLGLMGFHSYLQSKMIPVESVMATVANKRIFNHLQQETNKASISIANERGACPDAKEYDILQRFSYKMAVAPNASISIITGSCSPGIEPYPANIFKHNTLSGTFIVRNKYLDEIINRRFNGKQQDVWLKISEQEGSIQNLDEFTKEEKEVFKTAYEIDQRYLIEQAAERTPLIDQAQSLNVFLPASIDKRSLHQLHFGAWKKGIKTMYYLRSKSVGRAEKISLTVGNMDECLSCN